MSTSRCPSSGQNQQVLRRNSTLALALLGLAASVSPAAAIVIDSFTTNQAAVSDPPPTNGTVVTSGGGDILDGNDPGTTGHRKLLSRLSNHPGGTGPVTSSVAGGLLTVTITPTTPDSRGFANLVWDDDPTPLNLNHSGLGARDLTAGNQTSFRILVNSAAAGTELILDVYSDGNNWSRGGLRLPAVAAPTSFYLSYGTDFTVRGGGGVNFAAVGAIYLKVGGNESATNTVIDLIETVGPGVEVVKRDLDTSNNPITTPQLPGTTIRYRVTITNTGGQAANVDLADTITDDNLQLDPSTIDAMPVAVRDEYSTAGNVGRTIALAQGLLANDSDPDAVGAPPELVVTTTGVSATAAGGSVNVSADGSFTYDPPVGFGPGVDRFAYSIQDNDGNVASSEAIISIGRRIWFVDDVHGGSQVGTRDNPFVTLGAGNLAGAGGVGDQDAAGDLIYFFDGTHSIPALDLEAGQEVIGAGIPLVVEGETVVAVGTHPVIQGNVGDVLRVAANNVLRGFHLGAAANAGSNRIEGTNFGTLTISDLSIQNAAGGALNLTTGTLAANISGIAATAPSTQGIFLDAVGGSLTVTGSTAISNATDEPLQIQNAPAGASYSFATTTLSTNDAVDATDVAAASLTTFNATASTSFGSLAITTTDGPGLNGTGAGTINIAGTGNTINATGGFALGLSTTSVGSGATFSTLSSTNSASTGVSLDTVTGSVTATGGAISGSTGIAFDLNAGSSDVSYAGTISKSSTGRLIEVTARTGGTTAFSGNLTSNGTSSGINAASNTGGTINFSASSKVLNTGANGAVTLATNAGATINFTGGGLDIDTTSGTGFSATGGAAAISVQGTGNSVTSTSGQAIGVANTTIATTGLNFQNITAGTGAGSAGVGISVVGTGLLAGNGGLNVTGTGTAGSGGTIQHKTGADGSTTAGIGIFLQDTKDAKFAWMQLNDFDNSAIHGRNVHGFELTNSVINGVSGTNSGQVEGAVAFGTTSPAGNGLQGTGLLRNNRISGSIEHSVEFYNQSGTMNLTIEGTGAVSEGANLASPADDVADCIIEENSTVSGGDGILIEMTNTAVATIMVNRCLFRDNRSQVTQINALNDADVTATVSNSKARRFDQGSEGIFMQNHQNAKMTVMISNNTLSNFGGASVLVGQVAGQASSTSEFHASILNNQINQLTSATNHGIIFFPSSTVGQLAPSRVRIDGNVVVNNSTSGTTRGIIVDTPDASTSPSFHATVTNNSVAVGDNVAGVSGLIVQARQSSVACANIGSNTVTFPNGTPGGVFGLRARQVAPGTLNIESSGGCPGAAAAVLACRNPASTTEVLGTIGVVGSGTCQLPDVP